jgi:hypothetical protein
MGYEFYTQPTVFLGPVSALGGFYPPTGVGELSGKFTAFFETWTYTGNGSQTRYSLFSDQLVLPYSENYIVTIDGVMQSPNRYTIDAAYKFIDFDEPVPSGSELVITQIATLVTPEAPPIRYTTYYQNWIFTGDGFNNTYPIPTTGVLVHDPENYIVTINGVVQTPNTYTVNVSTATISLNNDVPNGSELSVTQIGSLRRDTYSFYSYDFNSWAFPVTGAPLSSFDLSATSVELSPQLGAYIVSIDGVIQAPVTDFNIDVNTRTLDFTTPIASGSLVRVQQLGSLGVIIEDDLWSQFVSISGGTITGNLSVSQNIYTTALTSQQINTNTFIGQDLVTNNIVCTNLTATNDVVTNFIVTTADSSIIFSEDYNSKIIHLDTTTTPEITASFPTSLPNGFNVSLVNAGTGIIYLSSDDVINSAGQFNSIQYTGMLIYKTNNKFFGIGVFE